MSLFKPYRFIQDTEIEAKANSLLTRMSATPNYAPKWPFDVTRVADFLDIGVFWDSIPADKQGQIAAIILPLERQIVLNEDIPNLRGCLKSQSLSQPPHHNTNHRHLDHIAVARVIKTQALKYVPWHHANN